MRNRTNRDRVFQALNLWANYVETGDPTLGAQDAQNMGRQPKVLTTEQRAMVGKLRDLSNAVLNTGTIPADDQ